MATLPGIGSTCYASCLQKDQTRSLHSAPDTTTMGSNAEGRIVNGKEELRDNMIIWDQDGIRNLVFEGA